MAHISYAGVAATLALTLTLGGTAYAADQLGKNVVKSRNIAPKAVKSSDIKPGAVTGVHVRESTLSTVPAAASAVTAGNVNGVREHAVRLAVAEPLNPQRQSAVVDGLAIDIGCAVTGTVIGLRATDPADRGMITFTKPTEDTDHWPLTTATPFEWDVPSMASGSATLLRAGGGVVRFDFHVYRELDAFGGNDCFVSGFVRSTG